MESNAKYFMMLFFQGFIQVFLVSLNTYLIANGKPELIWLVGFLISYTWTHNVKKVAFGSEWDRVIYAAGASIGTITGYFLGKLLS